MIKGADRRQPRPWVIFRQVEGHALEPCEAIPVAARIVALERRTAQPLRARDFERGAERERPPRDRPAVALGQRLDFKRGEIGIARGKVEPELDWRPDTLRFAHFPSPRDSDKLSESLIASAVISLMGRACATRVPIRSLYQGRIVTATP